MRLRIIQCEYAWWNDRLEPPGPVFLRSNLVAMEQIGLAEDTYDAPLAVDDRKSADVMLHQQLYSIRHGFIWAHSHNVADHHIPRVHAYSFSNGGIASFPCSARAH